MTTIEQRPTLYRILKAEGCELDYHETDLYVLDTPVARALIASYTANGGIVSPVRFRSEAGDGRYWLDLPFMNDPCWIRDTRPATYAEGRDAALADIEQVDEETWVGTAKDKREIAVRIVGTRIVVSVAPKGGDRAVAIAGFTESLPDGECYWVEAGDLLDRAEGRTAERILTLAGITQAPTQPVAAPGMR